MGKKKHDKAGSGGRGKRKSPNNSGTLRRAHAALHRFTEGFEQDIDAAVVSARSRQLAPLRYVIQVCRFLQRRYLAGDTGPPVARPTGLTIEVDLPAGLLAVEADGLAASLDRLGKAAADLEAFEGEPFPRRPVVVGTLAERAAARRRAAADGANIEQTTLSDLHQSAGDLIAVFQAAVAELARQVDRTKRPEQPHASREPTGYTPPQLAKKLRVGVDKVYTWIHSGALKAVDASKRRGGRPRYWVTTEAVDAFMKQRQVGQADDRAGVRRKAKGESDGVIEYF